jgi:peroxiredoxin
MTKVLAGHAAPAFTLHDTHGKKISLSEALAKGPVVVAFFKVSCPVCQFTFPFLERIHKAHAGDAVNFFGISQDDAADTKDFHAEYSITFESLVDDDGYPVSNAYGLTNVPTVFLIAPEGKVKVSCMGFSKADFETIAKELAATFKKKPATVFLPGEAVPDYKPG